MVEVETGQCKLSSLRVSFEASSFALHVGFRRSWYAELEREKERKDTELSVLGLKRQPTKQNRLCEH